MFRLLGNLAKTAVDTALLPVSMAVDVVTAGGVLTDTDAATPRHLIQDHRGRRRYV